MIDLTEYSKYSSSDFISDNITLYIPRRVTNITLDGCRVNIKLNAAVCKKEAIIISALMKGRSFTFTGAWQEMTMCLDFLNEDILRFRMNKGSEIVEKLQKMTVSSLSPACKPAIVEDAYKIVMITGSITVTVYKDPYSMEICNKDGKVLYSQYNDDYHNVSGDRRNGIKEGSEDDIKGEKARHSFPGFECFPFGLVVNEDNKKYCYTESVRMHYNEKFYGFGERFSRLDKNGQEVYIWATNPLGVSTVKAYKNVPFFMSSRGYGIYVNSPRKTRFKMGNYFFKAYSMEVEDELLDAFFIQGNQYKDVIHKYTSITGRSKLPPKWSFGVWMSRNCYRSRKEIEDVAQKIRDLALPCDVLHIDWDYCKGEYDYEFDESRFEDPKTMVQNLLNMGFRTSIWHIPYLRKGSPAYNEAVKYGYLACSQDGTPADNDVNEGVIDFSNPDAVKWYKSKIRKLLKLGIRVIKTDFGENASDDYIYRNIDGRDMHNLYPLLYNKAAYETCQEVWGDDALVWGRSAFAGNQRYPVYWGGDSDSDYSGMYHSLRGGLSIGLSGFPFWSHDVGGYFCTPSTDVYIRWLQFGMLSPLVRFHGTSAREPWAFGDEAVRQYKKYASIRYSLLEYIYSESAKCIEDGTPLMRALVIDFQEDLNVSEIDDQYMFGRNIMVAPVLSNEGYRDIYLPSGTAWLDIHNHKWYGGGKWIRMETPIGIMPIFLRGETITPFFRPMNYVGEKKQISCTLEICPVNDKAVYHLKTDEFDIYVRYDFEGDTGVGRLYIKGAQGLAVKFHINCPDVKSLRLHGQDVEFTREQNGFVSFTREFSTGYKEE